MTCPDGYYASLGYCYACVLPCVTCSTLSFCVSCSSGLYINEGKCVADCPANKAVIINNTCSTCPTGCTQCSQALNVEESQCSACTVSYRYYNQSCLIECPASLNTYRNTSNNRYYCLTDQQLAEAELGVTLSFSQLLPLPFTILGVLACIASFMSRLQSKATYIVGVIYCWWGMLEVASFAYLLIGVYAKTSNGNHSDDYEPAIASLATITLIIAFVLNVLALIVQTPYLFNDSKFIEWLHSDNQVANNN